MLCHYDTEDKMCGIHTKNKERKKRNKKSYYIGVTEPVLQFMTERSNIENVSKSGGYFGMNHYFGHRNKRNKLKRF